MRNVRLSCAIVAALLLVLPAINGNAAKPLPPKEATAAGPVVPTSLTRAGELLDEGFEGATFPPTSWTTVDTHAVENWVAGTNPYEGTYSAEVYYAVCGSLPCQDEWLITPSLDLSTLTTPELSFFVSGSRYWLCGLDGGYTNGDFTVYLSTTGNTPADFLAGTVLYDFCTTPPAASFDWTNVSVDLSAHSAATAAYIGFRYEADDASTTYVDSVQVGEVGTGSCCFLDGTCTEVTSAVCLGGGGTYHGPGTTCAATICPVVATNDACADATIITDDVFSNPALDTTGATVDESPTTSCASTHYNNNVWYTFTAVADGTASAATCGTSYDTVLRVYTGGCGSLTEVTCNDDSCSLQSEVSFAVINGTQYWIEAAAYSAGGGLLSFAFDGGGTVPVELMSFDVK